MDQPTPFGPELPANGAPSHFEPPPPHEGPPLFAAPPLRARHVYLKPITPADYPFLQVLETAGDLAPRWRHRGVTFPPEQWAQTLWSGVLTQFMVVGTQHNKPVGRVVVYQPNFQDRHAYFAALRFEPGEASPLMVLGISLFLRYVFGYWEFEKLYMEVPEYNFDQFASGLGRYFEIEGRLRNHFRTPGRAWDQLILAIHRETAIAEGNRLRLDYGERSEVAEAPVSAPSDVSGGGAPPRGAWTTIPWEEFVTEVAAIAEVPETEVHEDSRLLEDLSLDSLSLAELSVTLVERYDTWSISRDLENRVWENLTVRQVYDEYLTGVPASVSASPSAEPGVS